jgi:hypothetical protein
VDELFPFAREHRRLTGVIDQTARPADQRTAVEVDRNAKIPEVSIYRLPKLAAIELVDIRINDAYGNFGALGMRAGEYFVPDHWIGNDQKDREPSDNHWDQSGNGLDRVTVDARQVLLETNLGHSAHLAAESPIQEKLCARESEKKQ